MNTLVWLPGGFVPTALSAGALGVSGVAVWVADKPVLRQRWLSWAIILPTLWLVLAGGPITTAGFAAVLGCVAAREYARLIDAPRADRAVLFGAATAFPLVALWMPGWLERAPLLVLVAALPALLSGDADRGLHRAALTGFGVLWIGWSLAHLVLSWQDAYLICLAIAAADVAAWCFGTGLRRFGWARRPLTPLSPGKTWGGVLGSVAGAGLVLGLGGRLDLVLILAVGVGSVLGDLLESMAKRQAGVKDAGTWLPGFGGLLDRIDSLLVVLPLVVWLA